MLNEKLLSLLNAQVNFEIYSAYVYLSMAAYCESIDLSGFANFFKVQSQEELFHAMKFYDYIFQKNGVVTLEQIEKPHANFESIAHVFETGYEHEQVVTSRLYKIADVATEEREHATIGLLNWFINEQVEEENTFNTIIKKIKRCENNQAALYMLDDELAARIFTPPTTANA
ncbi:ferritin [Clostridium chromiireducens]|uniref:Ferritin n=1 Tax=Clostridium chromiireducens TaxID=225345 RepID=A0A1V4I9K5_9CLOT|nr:ferritin [Clostridium chromiireducens]OPJ56619.1 ferritin [Clostridium chromiireducens]RII33897.1 ferritin [Clostridium chromiireducens]